MVKTRKRNRKQVVGSTVPKVKKEINRYREFYDSIIFDRECMSRVLRRWIDFQFACGQLQASREQNRDFLESCEQGWLTLKDFLTLSGLETNFSFPTNMEYSVFVTSYKGTFVFRIEMSDTPSYFRLFTATRIPFLVFLKQRLKSN